MLFILLLMILSAEGSPVLHGKNSGSVVWKDLNRVVKNPGKFAYLVHLKIITQPRNKNREEIFQTCGGVLITRDMVLTAGHCVVCAPSERSITVTAGTVHLTADKKAAFRGVKEIEIHEVYKKAIEDGHPRPYPEDDLAILWLDIPYHLGEFIKLARLPQPNGIVNKGVGKVAGWGLTETGQKSEILKEGQLKVVDNSVCMKAYNIRFTNKAICILSDDRKTTPCEGDSGGPFVLNGVVEGIISFGRPKELACNTGKLIMSCDASAPVIVTSVKTYLEWIQYRIRNGSPKERKELEHFDDIVGGQHSRSTTKRPGQKKKVCDKKTKKCTIL